MRKKFTLPDIPAHLRSKRLRFAPGLQSLSARLSLIHTIAGVKVYYDAVNNALVYTSLLNVDGDGGPHCYHPKPGKGLDYLANAGHPGNWWGIYCDPKTGNPVIQKSTDPAPGYYVSTTSLVDPTKKFADQTRYANSEKIPYLAVSPALFQGPHALKLGDVATVMIGSKKCNAIIADSGNNSSLGEGSIYLAQQLGQPDNPKGSSLPTNHKINYVIYLSSALLNPDRKSGRLLNNTEIDAQATSIIQGRKIDPALYFA